MILFKSIELIIRQFIHFYGVIGILLLYLFIPEFSYYLAVFTYCIYQSFITYPRDSLSYMGMLFKSGYHDVVNEAINDE